MNMMQHVRQTAKNNKGFTLIELMIVVAIIGILAAIAVPQFSAYRAKGYIATCVSDAKNAHTGLVAWCGDNPADTVTEETITGPATSTKYPAIKASAGNTIKITAATAAGVPGEITVTNGNLEGELILDADGNEKTGAKGKLRKK